jgi:hypothetical protein
VKSGASTNCGCLSVRGRAKHGQAGGGGSTNCTKIYTAWRNIKQRCYNATNDHYHLYGARGITMSREFLEDFAAFYIELGEPPNNYMSIDRIDNNLGYIKGNLRWATLTEQARNRRTNRLLTYKGETKTVTEWCEIKGLPKNVVFARLNTLGWAVAKALETEVRPDIRTQ